MYRTQIQDGQKYLFCDTFLPYILWLQSYTNIWFGYSILQFRFTIVSSFASCPQDLHKCKNLLPRIGIPDVTACLIGISNFLPELLNPQIEANKIKAKLVVPEVMTMTPHLLFKGFFLKFNALSR